MMPARIANLDEVGRRRANIGGVVLRGASWIEQLVAYVFSPEHHGSARDPVVRLSIGTLLVVLVIVWQGRRIARGRVPELRAAGALGTIVALFLVLLGTWSA